ncbi:MAG: hypothetical protein AAGI09_14940 [Pseudomonadota bacterium]
MPALKPAGTGGSGPFIAHLRWGVLLLDTGEAIKLMLCCILLAKPRAGVANIDTIVELAGFRREHPDAVRPIDRAERH